MLLRLAGPVKIEPTLVLELETAHGERIRETLAQRPTPAQVHVPRSARRTRARTSKAYEGGTSLCVKCEFCSRNRTKLELHRKWGRG